MPLVGGAARIAPFYATIGLYASIARAGADAARNRMSTSPRRNAALLRSAGIARVKAKRQHTHVMVVEDDRDTREVVRLILEMAGMGVTEAADGLEALERLHSLRARNPHLPCVVVLDLMMPRCSGPEFRKRQLDDPLIADVPVIILSAVADQPRAEELAAFARVSKPFDPDRLVEAVRHASHAAG